MSTSPNLRLPYLDANQNQKTVTHNAALRMLDALVNLHVASAALPAPPAAPSDGQCWIVAPGGTGAWAGKDLNVAAWQDGAWSFYAPNPGTVAYVDALGAALVWNGTAWVGLLGAVAALALSTLGIGTAADPANPLSARLNAALFAALPTTASPAGTGDLRVKLSKQAAGNTASLLFQDGYSGRAEVGLVGGDDFHFKVSPDGATFLDALVLAAATGAASFLVPPTAPTPAAGDSSAKLATTAFVAGAVAGLVAAAPGALDTLKELSDALGDDPNFAATVTNALAAKAPLANPTFTGTLTGTGPTASLGGSPTTNGAFVYSSVGQYCGIYNSDSNLVYGLASHLPAPPGTSTLGGYYQGLGVGGATSGKGNPIFGVLNSGQGGNGVGSVAFTVYDQNVVVTFNNTLDDGSGNAVLAGNVSAATASFGTGVGSPGQINKISLYSNSYGFGISPGSLNYVVDNAGSTHTFYGGGGLAAKIGVAASKFFGNLAVAGQVTSARNTLDDGSGNATVSGTLTVMPAAAAPGTTQQGAIYTDSTLTALRWHNGTGWSRVTNFAKFAAYPGSDCYIAAATWTKVNFNNADTNDQGAFTASSSRFTAPEAGTYKVGASLSYKQNNSSAPTALQLAFYRNGAACGRGRAGSTGLVPGVSTVGSSVLLKLAAGDTVEAWAFFTGADGYVAAADSCFWADQLP